MFSAIFNATTVGPHSNSIFYGEDSSSSAETELKSSNSRDNRLQEFIKQSISIIPEVEYIFCRREEQAYFVWSIINRLDPAVRKRIYECQKSIIRLFPEEMFDFYIVARTDNPIESMVGEEEMEMIFKK